MDLGLENKIVLLTGATGGIGEVICQALLLEGAIVLPFYRGNKERLQAVFEWMEQNNIEAEKCQPIELDLSEKQTIKPVIDSIVSKYIQIDVLVNCAGKSIEKPFLLHDNQDIEEMLNINLILPTILTREVLSSMMKRKTGSIVNISSLLSHRFGRGVTAYAAAKAGTDRLTESIASEMGKKGIRINTVCPGVIETKMTSNLKLRIGSQLLDRTPMQRHGTPEDVAKAVLFLASDKTASYITGQRIVVDGGLSLL